MVFKTTEYQSGMRSGIVTPEGQARLIEHEGEILHAYPDSEGWLTIGIGHLIDKRKGGAISQRVSRLLFEDDIALATAQDRKSVV